ncbi:hypothetical protein [Nocardioides lianchengensis]|uniref:Uncharacterized protein n=1 Tax=Nocardioides lianchengensis TaxID=1045774 RepID=A0A1G6LS44_9ACTN|nr:hypothetical protein [Nocardioides lianchengensis]NYG12462.1 hypothetical protein [Nocardioides lianchengensis]SDC46029.1 hypothetical protein SAMN05421872_102342 [Nocardioides lianchengensis]
MLVVDQLVTATDGDEGGEASETREDLTAFVRLADGGKVRLTSGDTVPADADEEHVQRLVDAGVLTEAPDAPVPSPPPAPRTRAPRGSVSGEDTGD